MTTMKVSLLPFDKAISLASQPFNSPTRFSIFETGDNASCLLDCSRWNKMNTIKSQRRSNAGESKQKRKELRIQEKETVQNHRQTLPVGERHSNSELKRKRKQFTLEELVRSVENGCGSCRYYQALLDGLFLDRPELIRKDMDAVFQWDGPSLLSITENDSGNSNQFQFFSPTGARSIIQGFHSANLLQGDTSSFMSFDRATKWIHECEVSHQHCGVGRNVPLPKRLLDLAPPGQQDQQDIRLVETTNGMTGTYVCLSHCWGKDPMPVKTTTQTLGQFANFIPWISLPKTFQDAVAITRRLGIQYLWIDSLCIVQDSVQDWEDQSGRMADIYHNSYITIAAVSSSGFRGGCFPSNTAGDVCFEIEEQDRGRTTPVAIRDCKGTALLTEVEHITQAFPLLSRAWVYQERMLSRRVLYCNQSELQLECREGIACECDNRFIPPHPHPRTEAGKSMLSVKRQYANAIKKHGIRGHYSPSELSQHWKWVVMQYSRLQLTYPSDILPALSGCAKDIGQLTGDRYLAGIWRNSLAEGLLWTLNPPITHPRPTTPRAPSWSWASVDTSPSGIKYTHVLQTHTRDHFQSKIDDVDCRPLGSDTTGAVTPGSSITLRSRLCHTYLRRLCRQCARSRHKYTIEHEGLYIARNSNPSESWRSRACRFDEKIVALASRRQRCVYFLTLNMTIGWISSSLML